MKKQKLSTVILLDLFCVGAGLIIFALFHHVINFEKDSEPVVLMTSEPVQEQISYGETAAEDTIEAEYTPDSSEGPDEPEETKKVFSGMWGEKFADKFTEGDPVVTDTSYVSENINVSVSHIEENGIIYNIADIYISDIQYLKAGLAGDAYRNGTELIANMSSRLGAVVAISGDHYGARQEGTVLRNGILYRETDFEDVCVINTLGEMKTYTAEEFDIEEIKQNGAWQIWTFGPELLRDGEVKTSFNSDVTRANPRSAIGYVEPGHYYFVQVDGRINSSRGMTMEELSQLFYDLGCTAAYNLDGGQSAGFTWMGELISYPYKRPVWDIIYIGE